MRLVISDTTPLNYLILIGYANALHGLFGHLIVPPAVIRELRHPKAPKSVDDWAANLPGWIEIRAPKVNLGLDLGSGENEAISLAAECTETVLLLIDDGTARAAAEDRGLAVIGTLAVLDLAYRAAFLDFEHAIMLLQETSFHIEKTLLATVLAQVRARKLRR